MSFRNCAIAATSALALLACAVSVSAQTGSGGCYFGACTPSTTPQPQPQPQRPPADTGAGSSGPSSGPSDWQVFENRWVQGSGYVMFRTTSLKDCASLCARDNKCRMFEFYFGKEDGGAKCNLFAHTRMEASRSAESHVVIKR